MKVERQSSFGCDAMNTSNRGDAARSQLPPDPLSPFPVFHLRAGFISLMSRIVSVFVRLGKALPTLCDSSLFGKECWRWRPKDAIFPVPFPVSREEQRT